MSVKSKKLADMLTKNEAIKDIEKIQLNTHGNTNPSNELDNNKILNINFIAINAVFNVNGGFLNGRGTEKVGKKDVVKVKQFSKFGNPEPYISAQAWRKILRQQFIDIVGENSYYQRILVKPTTKVSKNIEKIGANPIYYLEDEVFGYTHPKITIPPEYSQLRPEVVALNRLTTVKTSILMPVPNTASIKTDNGYIHLLEGTPLPYTSEFTFAHYHAMIGIELNRIGRYRNMGDRVELDPQLEDLYVKNGILIPEQHPVFKSYRLKDRTVRIKKVLPAIFKSILLLNGGAKSSQYASSLSPRLIILAGLKGATYPFTSCIHGLEGKTLININLLLEKIKEYANNINTDIFIGIRDRFLGNQDELQQLDQKSIEQKTLHITSPGTAFKNFLESLGSEK